MRAEPDSHFASPADAAGPGWRVAVPAAVTLGSVVCAATAAYALASMGWDPQAGTIAHPHHLTWAAWMILAAEAFDTVDGLVARWMKATSAFGLQLDSLADAMSFGAAPALLVAVAGGGTVWSLATGLALVLCAVVRVARYNVEKPPEGPPPLHFKGLATPGAGGAIAAWVLLTGYVSGPSWLFGAIDSATRALWAQAMTAGLPAFGLLVAALMVSNRRYPDLTKHYARRVKPWWHVAVFAAAVVVAPEPALAAFFIGYVLWGLVAGPFKPTSQV